MNKRKTGVNRNYFVKRHLKLTGPVSEIGALLVEDVESLIGVDTVSLDIEKRTLRLSYDASRRHLDDITHIVKSHDCLTSTRYWQQVKQNWYRYFDQNIKENATKAAWRCH